MIPKIIHRVVNEHPGEEAERFWAMLQTLHPGWEFRSWRDQQPPEDFELGGEFEFASSGAQLADLVRLEVLWKHGGIYLDSDIEPVRSLEPLLGEELFIGAESMSLLGSAAIGCRPGHPAIRRCIDLILEEGRTRFDVPPNVATGPVLVTTVMAGRDDVTVLPPECFYPYPYKAPRPTDVREVTTRFTYGVHHWASSWLPVAAQQSRPLPAGLRARAARALRATAQPVTRPVLHRLRHVVREEVQQVAQQVAQQLAQPDPSPLAATFIGNNRVVVSLPDTAPLVCLADDLSMTPELVSRGIYDPRYWHFLGRHIKPGDRVIEVGANIGLFTVRLARIVGRFGHVFAWEPDPVIADVLEDNLQANWLTQQVTVVRGAASDSTGARTFETNPRLRMLGQLGDGASGTPVTTQRLDEAVRSDLPIHLVKIDVEGAEAAVLDGMKGLLDARCVRMIDIEVIRDNAGSDWSRLVRLMRQLVDLYGATTFIINGAGDLVPMSLDTVVATAGHHPHVVFRFP